MTGHISKSSVFLLFFVLVFMSHACVGIHVKNIPSGPLMVINEPSFVSKGVKEGESVEHAFRVFNKGDQPLEIKRVKPS